MLPASGADCLCLGFQEQQTVLEDHSTPETVGVSAEALAASHKVHNPKTSWGHKRSGPAQGFR